jgi:hypothetical protein
MSSRKRHQRQLARGHSPNAYDAKVLHDNPVAYWTLEGGSAGLTDRTGNGHHARAVNAYTVTSFLNGLTAMAFDGVNQYAEVADEDDLSVTNTGIITIEAWMRPDVLVFPNRESTGYVHWMGKGTNGQFEYVSRMYSLVTTDNPPRPNRISGYSFNLSGGLGTGSYFQDSVIPGEWIHYVLVINTVDTSPAFTTGYTKVYKNGVKRDQDRLTDYNIVPGNGSAPFRIGTLDFRSFFQGAVARVAIYNHELSPLTILDHYRQFVAAVGGSATFVQNIGTAVSDSAGTHVGITVPAGGIAAGHFLVVSVVQDHLGSTPTVSDNRGNVYTVDRSATDVGLTTRATVLSAPVHGALQGGDVIYVSFATPVVNKVVSIDQFTGVAFVNALDRSNGRQGTSTTPSANIPVTAQADELLFGLVGVAGPLDDSYAEDRGAEWTTLQRAGTDSGGASNVTLSSAWKSVNATSTYAYSPTLSVARTWLDILLSYRAGAAVVVPPPQPSVAFVRSVGTIASSTSSVGVVLGVPAPGVPAGNTLVVSVLHDYTSGTPVVSDSRGNTYAVIDTASDAGDTMRATQFVASVHAALLPGDSVVLEFDAAITNKMMAVNEFTGVAFSGSVDQTNHLSGTSATPGESSPITTTNADDLLLEVVGVRGQLSQGYEEDAVGFWQALPRVGTTDLTLNTACRPVARVDTYRYRPQLEVVSDWLHINSALKAGAAVVVPPPAPTAAFVRHVGSKSVATALSHASVVVPAGGVPAGHTLLIAVVHEHTVAAPTMADARGNVYTCDQSSPNAGNTMRASIFSAPVNATLPEGDRVTVFFPVAVSSATISVSEFSGIVFSGALDQKNNISGNSTQPGVSTAITTTHADDLLFGFVAVNGAVSDAFESDEVGLWTDIPRTTVSSSMDLTANTAFRGVATTGSYRFRPTLGVARPWIDIIASYKAGAVVVTPPPIGSAQLVKAVGSASTKVNGTTLWVVVPAGGVAAGNTLLIRVVHDYTAGGGAVTDSRGNTYVRDRTAANAGNGMRASLFRSVVGTALQAGDVITLTTTAVAARVMSVDEFSNVLAPSVIDQQNGATNTGTAPNVAITTTNANDLIVGMCATQGPETDGFDDDPLWLSLARTGTTGGGSSSNKTVGGAYRSVASTALYRYQPTLGVSASWIQYVVAYRGV